MTESELKRHYTRLYKTLQAEKAQRQSMLARKPHRQQYWNARIDDMDTAIKSLVWLKDQLKPHAEPDIAQAPLLEMKGNDNAGY